jgi:hypothetical protein
MKRLTLLQNKSNQLTNNDLSNVGYITEKLFPHWIRLLVWSLQLSPAPYKKFGARIAVLWKANGVSFTVQYLKECTRIVQHFVSGHPVFVTDVMPIGLAGGLPTIIPGTLRTLLRSKDPSTIRGVLSTLAVFRIMKMPCELKLESITDPFSGISDTLPKSEVINGLAALGLEIPKGRSKHLLTLSNPIIYLLSAGPNHSISMMGIWKDIYAWYISPLFPTLLSFIGRMNKGNVLIDLLRSEVSHWEATGVKPSVSPLDLKLGKLAIKEEAAGKARVFAMADSITQSVMAPLNSWVFAKLKDLPMDGTFNQQAPLNRLVSLYKDGLLHDVEFYSYDLSSATDRLPMAFQKQIISILFGSNFANDWATLLVGRDWYLKDIPYRYSVGQPMGALSSWAMLALSHHVIVQIAAMRVGKLSFTSYALLGDDIVIADKAVAASYHMIMTQILGVEINLSKSLVSSNSFEFAKRLVTMDGEVSAVGAKNLLVALKSRWGISSVILDLYNKGLALSEQDLRQRFSSIPTVSKQFGVDKLLWLVLGPFGFIPSKDGLSAFMKLNRSLSLVDMHILLSCVDEAKFDLDKKTWEANIQETIHTLFRFGLLSEPAGFEVFTDFASSPLYSFIRAQFGNKLSTLVQDKPVRRLIFDGPLLHFTFYTEGWCDGLMEHLTKKIQSDSQETVSPSNPFKDDKVILPLRGNIKGISFFKHVLALMAERDPATVMRWM